MIRTLLRSSLASTTVAAVLLVSLASRGQAQGSITGLGFGYPVGGGSVRTNGTAGAFAEFDALTPTNPASLGGLGRVVLAAQAEPEFRTLTLGTIKQRNNLQRVPLIALAIPARRGWAIGLSASTFLDRTYTTSTTGTARIDNATVPTTDVSEVRGAINDLRAAAGWQISPRFRVGFAGHLLTGEHKATRERTFADTLRFGSVLDSSNVTYFGSALSVGGEASLGKGFYALASYRRGNSLDARIRDTVRAKASAPSRAGFGLRYDGIAGSVFAAGVEQVTWTDMNGLGSSSFGTSDALNLHVGAEVAGPKYRGFPVLLRAGYARNELPFSVPGQQSREHRIAGGLGLPIARENASIDLSIQRAARTMTGSAAKESGWLLGFGVQIRP